MSRLNRAQRVVLVIGLGFAFTVLGEWITIQGEHALGWVSYSPLGNSTFTPSLGGLHPWVKLLVWIGLIGIWSVASVVLLRSGGDVK